MDLGLAKKHAVVLAASKGLGLATAKEFLAEGAKVTICSSNKENLKKAELELAAIDESRCTSIVADLTEFKEIDELFNIATKRFGEVDVLVVNTGGPKPGVCSEISNDEWQTGFEQVFMSAVRAINNVLPNMKKNKWGSIIAITSISVKNPIPNLAISNSMRAGLTGMLKSLADDVAPFNITVNSVCPGYINTDRVQQLLTDSANRQNQSLSEVRAELTNKIPLNRLGEPKELAALVTFLASEKARYITGATYWIDGGMQRSLM